MLTQRIIAWRVFFVRARRARLHVRTPSPVRLCRSCVQKWYVNIDDLIGGFDIGTVQAAASESHAAENVAWGLQEHIAQHIVRLHNEWLSEEQRTVPTHMECQH